jgi:hypothetical protein
MSSDPDEKFDGVSFMERVEALILTTEITDEQKIEILQKLLAAAEGVRNE